MTGDPPGWWQYPPFCPVYPTYTPPTYTGPALVLCNWFDDKDNRRFMYFTSCGAQVEEKKDWWAHCPKCGGKIAMRADPTSEPSK